jgi:hypothetical protein
MSPSFCLWLYSPCGHWQLFQFLNLYTVDRTPSTGDQPAARPLPTHRTTQTQNKRTQTFMLRGGFEPTTPVLERAKTVHALESAYWPFLQLVVTLCTIDEKPKLKLHTKLWQYSLSVFHCSLVSVHLTTLLYLRNIWGEYWEIRDALDLRIG